MMGRERIRIWRLAIALLALVPGVKSVAATGAEVEPPQWALPAVLAPRLQHGTFESAAARASVSFHVYTPPAYDRGDGRRFPVLHWLHGTGGGVAHLRPLAAHFDAAIGAGKIPPMLIVFPNGLAEGMWCDSKDGRTPIETMLVRELVPHVDATFRTIATRDGRMIEGFSMGGYGAARIGFKHHDLFGAVSILGAGPLDMDFKGPRATANPAQRERIFRSVWGGDIGYYRAQGPWVLAEQNRHALAGRSRIRQIVGDRDAMLPANRDLDAHLTRLGIAHDFIVPPGVGHNPLAVFAALGDAGWQFYAAAASHDARGNPTGDAGQARRLFFAFGKAMSGDPIPHQQRARDAVRSITERLEPLGFVGHVLQEHAGDRDDPSQDSPPFLVTRKRVLSELEALRQGLGPDDTIVIYSHSHGTKGRDGRLGGLPLDDPGTGRWRPIYLDWREYADRLLRLPARTVVVLTMACHSGGLADFLNSDESAKNLWQSRKDQGRNFLVMTSQNSHALSNPRRIEGAIINPFTHALIKAFGGEADGYRRGMAETHPDGRITLGELADFVVDEAKRHTAPNDASNDPDPQVTGSFFPDTVIAALNPATAQSPSPSAKVAPE